MAAHTLGIDLGGTKCLLGWFDAAGTMAHRERVPSPPTPDEFVDLVAGFVAEHPVDGVGVGLPGFVSRDRRSILHCPNLPAYQHFPMADTLASRLGGLPVWLENDANAAALAEARLGAGQGHADQIFVILGSGVGGGIIANGELVRGIGYAGEVGHITLDPQGPLCGCGRNGCWEMYASGRAFARAAGVEKGEQIGAALAAGEQWGLDALARYAPKVAEGLADLVLALAPSLVVLGGGVSEIGSPLSTAVADALPPLLPDFVEAPQVVTATLGNDAGAIGAALAR